MVCPSWRPAKSSRIDLARIGPAAVQGDVCVSATAPTLNRGMISVLAGPFDSLCGAPYRIRTSQLDGRSGGPAKPVDSGESSWPRPPAETCVESAGAYRIWIYADRILSRPRGGEGKVEGRSRDRVAARSGIAVRGRLATPHDEAVRAASDSKQTPRAPGGAPTADSAARRPSTWNCS